MRRLQAGGTSSESFRARRSLRGVVPLAAMLGGLALALGFWTRIAAAVSLVVVLSLQLGSRVDVPVQPI